MAALTGYELRADERRPVLESPDYDVHFIRNETQGDELLYVLRDCPAAMNPARQPKFGSPKTRVGRLSGDRRVEAWRRQRW